MLSERLFSIIMGNCKCCKSSDIEVENYRMIQLLQLTDMGFEYQQAEICLALSNYDMATAVECLSMKTRSSIINDSNENNALIQNIDVLHSNSDLQKTSKLILNIFGEKALHFFLKYAEEEKLNDLQSIIEHQCQIIAGIAQECHLVGWETNDINTTLNPWEINTKLKTLFVINRSEFESLLTIESRKDLKTCAIIDLSELDDNKDLYLPENTPTNVNQIQSESEIKIDHDMVFIFLL